MLLLHETRCGVDEIRHEGAVAIADGHGEHSYGDTLAPVPLRSTGKPFILGALLEEALGDEPFSDAELALMSGSHNGEPQHVSLLLELLARYDISPELLKCGIHEKWKSWSIPSPLGNNCSGKHAAFLIATKILGQPISNYTDIDTGLHRSIVARLTQFFGEQPHSFGIDGCSIPTCAFSLAAIARAYRRFANDEAGPSCARVRAAHRAAAFYVAGTDRLESYLIGHYGLAAKSGSDGLWALGIPTAGVGISVKVWSGMEAAVQAVLLDIIDRRGIIDIKSDPYLAPYHTRRRYSLAGSDVGMIEVCFLERH